MIETIKKLSAKYHFDLSQNGKALFLADPKVGESGIVIFSINSNQQYCIATFKIPSAHILCYIIFDRNWQWNKCISPGNEEFDFDESAAIFYLMELSMEKLYQVKNLKFLISSLTIDDILNSDLHF